MIPENLVNSTLNVLDLRMNELRCSIPQTFPEDCNFNNLYLNGNQLEGPLPPSLVSCGYLNALDVENNKINVNFPDWSADLLELQVLILWSNRFHGPVGNSNSNARYLFPKLLIIDLCHTAFAGLLPTEYFLNFKCMMLVDNKIEFMVQVYLAEYYSAILAVKGDDREMERILTVFTFIAWWSNLFEGQIPKMMGKLNSPKGSTCLTTIL